jgi:hypothetical protein
MLQLGARHRFHRPQHLHSECSVSRLVPGKRGIGGAPLAYRPHDDWDPRRSNEERKDWACPAAHDPLLAGPTVTPGLPNWIKKQKQERMTNRLG